MNFNLTLQRRFTQLRDQASGLEYIKQRAISKKLSQWEIIFSKLGDAEFDGERYVYTCTLTFQKKAGNMEPKVMLREWRSIVTEITKQGEVPRFQPYPWKITHQEMPSDIEALAEASSDDADEDVASFIQSGEISQVRHAMDNATGVTIAEVREKALPIINELLADEKKLRKSEYFRDIFDREAQIRSALSSVKSFLETNGERRNHVIFYGLPACAKSQICQAIFDLLGNDAVVKLDGPSTTPAGIYKTYFEELKDIPEPPFAWVEEMEKTNEESLRVWLGALDDRGQLRKVNARQMLSRNINILCFATVNDKEEFDRLMGGTATKPGALSSRFAHQIYCPRPDRKVLKKILERDIHAKGGDLKWAEPALQLALDIGTDDPRKVLGFLDGGERLIDGSYQRDILKIHTARKAEADKMKVFKAAAG